MTSTILGTEVDAPSVETDRSGFGDPPSWATLPADPAGPGRRAGTGWRWRPPSSPVSRCGSPSASPTTRRPPTRPRTCGPACHSWRGTASSGAAARAALPAARPGRAGAGPQGRRRRPHGRRRRDAGLQHGTRPPARRCWPGASPARPAGVVTAWVAAIRPGLSTSLVNRGTGSEAVYLFVVATAVWCVVSAAGATRRGRAVRVAGAGLLVGLAYLTRPEGLFFAVPLGLAVLFLGAGRHGARTSCGGRRAAAPLAVCFAVPLLVCIAPYAAYLHAHTGKVQLSAKTQDVSIEAWHAVAQADRAERDSVLWRARRDRPALRQDRAHVAARPRRRRPLGLRRHRGHERGRAVRDDRRPEKNQVLAWVLLPFPLWVLAGIGAWRARRSWAARLVLAGAALPVATALAFFVQPRYLVVTTALATVFVGVAVASLGRGWVSPSSPWPRAARAVLGGRVPQLGTPAGGTRPTSLDQRRRASGSRRTPTPTTGSSPAAWWSTSTPSDPRWPSRTRSCDEVARLRPALRGAVHRRRLGPHRRVPAAARTAEGLLLRGATACASCRRTGSRGGPPASTPSTRPRPPSDRWARRSASWATAERPCGQGAAADVTLPVHALNGGRRGGSPHRSRQQDRHDHAAPATSHDGRRRPRAPRQHPGHRTEAPIPDHAPARRPPAPTPGARPRAPRRRLRPAGAGAPPRWPTTAIGALRPRTGSGPARRPPARGLVQAPRPAGHEQPPSATAGSHARTTSIRRRPAAVDPPGRPRVAPGRPRTPPGTPPWRATTTATGRSNLGVPKPIQAHVRLTSRPANVQDVRHRIGLEAVGPVGGRAGQASRWWGPARPPHPVAPPTTTADDGGHQPGHHAVERRVAVAAGRPAPRRRRATTHGTNITANALVSRARPRSDADAPRRWAGPPPPGHPGQQHGQARAEQRRAGCRCSPPRRCG